MSAENALALIQSGEKSCVVVRAKEIIYAANGRGIAPLLAVYRDEPEKLKDSFVLDKIIGKAAAAILVQGGAYKAYGEIMSIAGRDLLTRNALAVEYGSLVDAIKNRNGDGICPIEQAVLDIDDPQECVARIEEAVRALARQG
jgi:hypothetical protein